MSQPSAARQPIPIGKYFLERGRITPEQLDEALKHRLAFGLKLGQSLVQLGLVTESDMVEALRHQARFPCIHLTSGIVETRVAHKVGEPLSRRLGALALNQIAGHTTVALEDPSDEDALTELAHVLGTRIFPVYAEPSVIRGLLEQVFGPEKGALPSRPAGSPAQSTVFTAPEPRSEPAAAPAATSAPDERAVVERVRGILQHAFEQSVSDIHLEAGADELRVRYRIDGVVREHVRLPGSWARPAIACLKALAQIDGKVEGDDKKEPRPREGSIPFVFRKQDYEVRVATTPSLHGESAVLHIKSEQHVHRDLGQIGLAAGQLAELEEMLAARDGLLLVAGPSGSGRSSTQHAIVERQATPERKIVVVTAQVEHELPGVLYVEPDHTAPAAGLHAVLGQDPDLLVVDELDGRETARTLLAAALSGRRVLAGQRTSGALEGIARLMQLGLESYLLADAVRGVIGQRLVRRICSDCKAPIVPDELLCERLGLPREGAIYYEGEGCDACHGTGHRERLGLFEVLSMTPILRREIEKGSGPQALAQAARASGFASLREQGLSQARAGVTTLHEVLAATSGT